jgi:isoaspartyl peptidase/L-asparaginase-like protein (Ntn-hydrolase superfamily)
VSCTGDGEAIIRTALAHEVDALMRLTGLPLADACERALTELVGGTGGLIAVDSSGGVAARFTTPAMPHGWRVGDGPPVARLR